MKRAGVFLALALAALTVPALAAENSTDNFVRARAYRGQFSDVAEGSVFYDNVSALYEYGLAAGKPDGTYGPSDPATVGQTIIFAGRVRSLYAAGDPEAGPAAFRAEGQQACEPYLRYLRSLGALGEETGTAYGVPITRKLAAHILSSALPEGALPDLNGELVERAAASGAFIPDVTASTDWRGDILRLYRWGVTFGSDGAGSFLPEETLTRGAMAAILTRMMDPALRGTPAWEAGAEETSAAAWQSAAGTTWGELSPPGTGYTSPATEEEIASAVAWMLSREQNVLTLQYPGITAARAREIMNRALEAAKAACEQCYNTVRCSYDTAGRLEMTFSAVDHSPEQVAAYRAYTLEAAIAVHDRLWQAGQLTASMSQYEKARVYYDWVCQNCAYDAGAGDGSLSHIAYALFHDGKAVCDGYTGAYNLLLKLEGIDCYALPSGSHIWTVAELDGTEYHIDATWGDGGEAGTNYDYFAMTPEQSWKVHDP